MKKIMIIICAAIAGFASHAQDCAANKKIISPVSKKPIEATVALADCNGITVQWKGNPSQVYELSFIVKDAAGNKTITAPAYTQNNELYKASVSAKPGTKVSWVVQGISVINNRKFYSYPVRSKEITLPDCKSPAVVANSNNSPQDNAISKEKIAIKIYPNPANSILNISIGGNFTKGTVHVYDALGKELIAKQIAQGNMQLLVNNLSAGIYFIRIIDTSGKLLYNGKFVKQ